MKKTIALLLCLLLTFGSVSLTALAEAEPVTLTMFVDETWWPYHDWSGDMPRWFTEQTGVQFDVSVAADITELDMMVASGSYPGYCLPRLQSAEQFRRVLRLGHPVGDL